MDKDRIMTRIKDIYTDYGVINLFIDRVGGYGGRITKVTQVIYRGTRMEVVIPLEKIKDDESLNNYIEAIKGDNGIVA